MNDIFEKLLKKKEKLDKYRPLPPEAVKNVEEWLDIEYTYTSNWIEGNTLDRTETALVVEKGLTIAGKTLREHLEATNHIKAIDFIRQLATSSHQFITEDNIKDIHKIILTGINDQWAGKYRQIQIFIRGAPVEPPPANEVSFRMKKLIEWLSGQQQINPVKVAADFHYRFVAIHPFIDGNGRTARLLLNLILISNSYPIAIIKTDEREVYMSAIQKGTLTNDLSDFYSVITGAVDRSLDAYLALVKGKSIIPYFVEKEGLYDNNLLQIGQVAQLANVSIPTIRYYVSLLLIFPEKRSKGGFMLFDPKTVETIKEIKRLQKEERLTIFEIKEKLLQTPSK